MALFPGGSLADVCAALAGTERMEMQCLRLQTDRTGQCVRQRQNTQKTKPTQNQDRVLTLSNTLPGSVRMSE